MLGYYRDPAGTEAATAASDWLRTGDLGVRHPDGYVELTDRKKDVIITGGENVASIEVENVLLSHPAVLEAAVVARPDGKWGEVPVAFVTTRRGVDADPGELISFVRARTAHFKAPKEVIFGELPKTSTGKVRKHVLRERARGET
jgi:fatty-acyl-CoA synthase